MNIIKVKDFDSMQSITVSLARNGYLVTAESVTDENYKNHWEIKYCEFSEINKISDVPQILHQDASDVITDESMTVITSVSGNHNTKDVKCEILSDEKPLVENKKEEIDLNSYGLLPRHNAPDIIINT